jgi:hypothetical protein
MELIGCPFWILDPIRWDSQVVPKRP